MADMLGKAVTKTPKSKKRKLGGKTNKRLAKNMHIVYMARNRKNTKRRNTRRKNTRRRRKIRGGGPHKLILSYNGKSITIDISKELYDKMKTDNSNGNNGKTIHDFIDILRKYIIGKIKAQSDREKYESYIALVSDETKQFVGSLPELYYIHHTIIEGDTITYTFEDVQPDEDDGPKIEDID